MSPLNLNLPQNFPFINNQNPPSTLDLVDSGIVIALLSTARESLEVAKNNYNLGLKLFEINKRQLEIAEEKLEIDKKILSLSSKEEE